MQVDFYHLARSAVEQVLPRIAERVLAGGGRLLVVAGDDALARHLDERLWSYAPDSFLPHARACEDDAEQPILIADGLDPANGARNVALADGTWRDAALAFDRAFYLFGDEAVKAARAAWRGLAEREDVTRNFWKQEGGKWIEG